MDTMVTLSNLISKPLLMSTTMRKLKVIIHLIEDLLPILRGRQIAVKPIKNRTLTDV